METLRLDVCSLGGDTAMPGGLHARLCRAFLVLFCKLCTFLLTLTRRPTGHQQHARKPTFTLGLYDSDMKFQENFGCVKVS